MLHLHRAERTDALVAALATMLSDPPSRHGVADPFIQDVVVVPTHGVERWLSQRLSHVLGADRDDGVCAAVRFPRPAELSDAVSAAVTGSDADASPWELERLQWDVLTVLDEAVKAGEPAFGQVAAYLGRAATSPGAGATWSHRRLTTARLVARRFTEYAAQRPAMLQGWAAGVDEDGTGAALGDAARWQALAWRRVRERIVQRTGVASPAEQLPDTLAAIVADPTRLDLPDRLSVFGPTRLSTAELGVLDALAAGGRAVHLWLPHPSPALWTRLQHDATKHTPAPALRADDRSGERVRLPLLRSLGRDARELQRRLAQLPSAAAATDQHLPAAAAAPPTHTLLARLQRAVRDDEPGEPQPLDPDDFSVQVHTCHGLPRQVEVLRELLVGMLADDATLEPRDVIVMCPDVEQVAPVVAAAFGRIEAVDAPLAHPGHALRVKAADRSLLQVNALLSLLGQVLEHADARWTPQQVLGLLATPAVRRRFGLDDDELELLTRWSADVGVRWGLDAGHRAEHGLPHITEQTWAAALRRLLLGASMSDDGLPLVQGVLPYDAVPSQGAELAGRFAEILDRVRLVVRRLHGPQPLAAWVAALTDTLDLLAAVPPDEQWQDAAARRLLAEVVDQAGPHATTTMLTLADVRALLADRLAGRPTRANFRTGDLTVCSLVPMRAVPHRVVVLLGLDDDAFPRIGTVQGDDVLAQRACVGDRDVRSEDRQILLDAIHAATERLVVIATGMNPRTNATEPLAVPIGELLDTLRALVPAEDQHRLEVRHPLQPFDPDAFRDHGQDRPRASAVSRPFSFDPAMLDAARALRQERLLPVAIRDLRLPPVEPPDPTVELPALAAMVTEPAKAFLRQRLGARVSDPPEAPPGTLPLTLKGLQRWAVGDRLLAAQRSGGAERVLAVEPSRGLLPPGPLGALTMSDVHAQAAAIAALVPRSSGAPSTVTAGLPDGRTVTAAIECAPDGQTIVSASFSALRPRSRMSAWLSLLVAIVAGWPRDVTAETVGRDPAAKDRVLRACYRLPDDVDPVALLADAVAVRDRGLAQVLPVPANAALEYASQRGANLEFRSHDHATGRAASQWQYEDAKDAANVWVWGADATFDELVAVDPPVGERLQQPSWFADLAVRIWRPMLNAESCRRVEV